MLAARRVSKNDLIRVAGYAVHLEFAGWETDEQASDAVTGSLKLERAPLQKAVYFRDGQIQFAASNDPKDQLASILVEEGRTRSRPDAGRASARVRGKLRWPYCPHRARLYHRLRELAEAARIKVEKILTDLYGWKEGTYAIRDEIPSQRRDRPGAIDKPRLMLNSIRRIEDRDWVLKQLDSLEAILSPGSTLSSFIQDTQA